VAVGFHESFWVITGTAAPVIALAIIVALADAKRGWFGMLETGHRLAQEANVVRSEQARYLFARALRVTFGFRVVATVNLLLQAGLLAVSLVSVAGQENLIPPWLAIVAAVGGLLLLAISSVFLPIGPQVKQALDRLSSGELREAQDDS
jgi:hypothetical protein